MLITPVDRNAARQPQCTATQGTISGARIAPRFAPELEIPVASERSRCGNHSVTVLIAAGKLPDSPSPRQPRAIPNSNALLASACPIADKLQIPMNTQYPMRVPSL